MINHRFSDKKGQQQSINQCTIQSINRLRINPPSNQLWNWVNADTSPAHHPSHAMVQPTLDHLPRVPEPHPLEPAAAAAVPPTPHAGDDEKLFSDLYIRTTWFDAAIALNQIDKVNNFEILIWIFGLNFQLFQWILLNFDIKLLIFRVFKGFHLILEEFFSIF